MLWLGNRWSLHRAVVTGLEPSPSCYSGSDLFFSWMKCSFITWRIAGRISWSVAKSRRRTWKRRKSSVGNLLVLVKLIQRHNRPVRRSRNSPSSKQKTNTSFIRETFDSQDTPPVLEATSRDVIAAMLEGKNNTFSLPWEIRSIFMQNCFIVSALQHGRRENPL